MASSPVPRSHSRASFYSTTTYHSFQDIELYEPGTQSETSATTSARSPRLAQLKDREAAPVRRSRPFRSDDPDSSRHPSSFQMVRQDSGYESSTPHHRHRRSSSRSNKQQQHRSSSKRTSPSPARTDNGRAPRQRPALRRSGHSKSVGPISHMPARSSLNINRPASLITTPQQQQQQQQNLNRKHSYFQFPSPDHLDLDGGPPDHSSSARPSIDLAPVILKVNTANANSHNINQDEHHSQHHHPSSSEGHQAFPLTPLNPHSTATPTATSPPPQTTHYWTSDRTRRLEYAAIDAASRGVRGWVLRHVVPDCFVSSESGGRRHLGFDDDGGSVRRYRLDLEIECPEDAVPPSPVGEKPRGFRARSGRGGGGRSGWWARFKGCSA